MEIKVYATLRDIVGNHSVRLEDAAEMNVDQILQQLFAKHPELRSKLLDNDGRLNPTFHIFINGRNVQYLNGLETIVTTADDVRIFPPVGGGRR